MEELSKYQKQKEATKKWRENNKKYFYELNKKHVQKWISNNIERYREKSKLRARRSYTWKKISKEFFNILKES